MERNLFQQDVPDYKKAIIIGASSGIGKELTKILVKSGYFVGITGRREHLLKELQEQFPERIFYRAFDIRDLSKTTKSIAELIKEMGGLDLLVLSSGVGYINEELDIEPEFQTIDTNVTAFTDIMCYTFLYFQKKKKGQIVGISSIAALRGNKSAPAYNASKSYQSNYMEGLRIKAKQLKIPLHITEIRPGFVDTDMAKGKKLFWVASPEKAASKIYQAIRRKKKIQYISKRWGLFALLLKIAPAWMYDHF